MSDSESRELKEERKKALIFPREIRIWWASAYNAFADEESLKSSFLGRRMYSRILRTCPVPQVQVLRTEITAPWLVPPERSWGEIILFPSNMRALCYPFDSCIRGAFQFPVSITPRGSDVDLSRTHVVIDFYSRDIPKRSSPSSFHDDDDLWFCFHFSSSLKFSSICIYC